MCVYQDTGRAANSGRHTRGKHACWYRLQWVMRWASGVWHPTPRICVHACPCAAQKSDESTMGCCAICAHTHAPSSKPMHANACGSAQ